MSNLLKNLLIALGLALILFIGYFLFMGGDDTAGTSGSEGVVFSAAARQKSQELFKTIQELKEYNVDASVLSSEKFRSLEDFRVELGSEPSGRPNPFAPY